MQKPSKSIIAEPVSYTHLFTRMKGFTELSGSKNPTEYSRQYVDEIFESTDVTGYSPSWSFAFDDYTEDAVLEEKGEAPARQLECTADITIDASIDKRFVPSGEQRMDLYRRIAAVRTQEAVSYTHLDVYKRQSTHRWSWRRRWTWCAA